MPERLYVLIVLLLLLTGCGKPEGQALLEDYLYRLSNSLDVDIDTELDKLPPIVGYPARRERLVPPVEIREGVIDTLKLGQCNLLNLIAERNSSLGRVMPVSKQLVYELRFFDGIRQCRAQPSVRDDPELLAQVDEIYRQKLRNLPRILWNAIYNAPEMEAQFALGELPLAPDAHASIGPVLQALTRFEQLAQLVNRPEQWQLPDYLDTLEESYQVFNSNRFGAHWLSSIRLLTSTLNRAADALEIRLDGRALCPQGHPTPEAKILQTVFRKYYGGNVQPYLALTHRSGQQWLARHEKLLGTLEYSDKLSDYQQQVLSEQGKLWTDYERARDRHTQAWQQQLTQCAMMPGSA